MGYSREEYEAHCEENNGYCTSCGAIQWGDTEPDAEDGICETCGQSSVMGFEQALLCGFINVIN